MPTYNVAKLHSELLAASIPIFGCDSSGNIEYNNATEQQITSAEAIKSAHSETWYVDQRIAAYPNISDQLDMIYWDKVNTTTTWKDAIAQVKSDYPKPS